MGVSSDCFVGVALIGKHVEGIVELLNNLRVIFADARQLAARDHSALFVDHAYDAIYGVFHLVY